MLLVPTGWCLSNQTTAPGSRATRTRTRLSPPPPASVATGDGTAYQSLFGDMPVQDAVQNMFCQIAQLGGMLCGDNMADTVHTTGRQASAMVDAAFCVGRSIQVLLGPVHTSKHHRLMWHLRGEPEGRGNLWEGDTSRYVSLHKVCKKMYLRSNKRGPTLAMQMMRGEQAQTEILRGLTGGETDDDAVSEDEERVEQVNAMHTARVDGVDVFPYSVLHMSTRGVRIAVGVVSALPVLQDLPTRLEMDVAETVVGAKTLKFNPKFEWGAQSRIQFLRATTSFNAKPYFDHLRYKADNGEVHWGEARLVLRRVGPRSASVRCCEAHVRCSAPAGLCTDGSWVSTSGLALHYAAECLAYRGAHRRRAGASS